MLILALAAALWIQDDARIEELVRKLTDPSIDAREEACRELIKIGPKAIPALEKAGRSADTETRERALWTLKKIRSRQRAAELGLEKLIPLDVQAKMPDLMEKVAAEDPADKVKLLEDLNAAIEGGTLTEKELTWIGALLVGPVNPALRTHVYIRAKLWWYDGQDEALRESGRKILEDMGETFLRDWTRILARIADSPSEILVFDPEVASSNRGGSEEGQLSAAAIAEMAEQGGLEIVPILVDIATDSGADVAARKAAVTAVGAVRKRWTAKKKE